MSRLLLLKQCKLLLSLSRVLPVASLSTYPLSTYPLSTYPITIYCALCHYILLHCHYSVITVLLHSHWFAIVAKMYAPLCIGVGEILPPQPALFAAANPGNAAGCWAAFPAQAGHATSRHGVLSIAAIAIPLTLAGRAESSQEFERGLNDLLGIRTLTNWLPKMFCSQPAKCILTAY